MAATPPSSPLSGGDRPPPRLEPPLLPVNGVVQPPTVPPPERPGRLTNKLLILKTQIIKVMWINSSWNFYDCRYRTGLRLTNEQDPKQQSPKNMPVCFHSRTTKFVHSSKLLLGLAENSRWAIFNLFIPKLYPRQFNNAFGSMISAPSRPWLDNYRTCRPDVKLFPHLLLIVCFFAENFLLPFEKVRCATGII
jgi:hypothetical protein